MFLKIILDKVMINEPVKKVRTPVPWGWIAIIVSVLIIIICGVTEYHMILQSKGNIPQSKGNIPQSK
jgi:hypothetical protein